MPQNAPLFLSSQKILLIMDNGINTLTTLAATAELISPYGRLIETDGADSFLINNGTTERFHALAQADVWQGGGEAIISIFRGQPFSLPLTIGMMERHPLGSQAFVPLQNLPWIAVLARDNNGKPDKPEAFLMSGNQGIQYHRNVWHHPLISLEAVSDFLVIDRAGGGNNLEEVDFAEPYELRLG